MNTKKLFCVAFLSLIFLSQTFAKIYVNEISGNDKWLEIYNDASSEVDLTGYKIRKINELAEIVDWSIPNGTKITAKGYISWQRDIENLDGSTFIWGISAKKDVTFIIIDKDGKEMDKFEVTSLLFSEGLSRTVGRKTDGNTELVVFKNGGTRNTSNDSATIQVPTANPKKIYVNEMNGNKFDVTENEIQKWLEIYNAENEAVVLTDYSIQRTDELGRLDNWFIPAGTTIPAKGFLTWNSDIENLDGSTFTWGISAKKDVTFKIFDNNGTLLDFFEVNLTKNPELYSEGNGYTLGREYDGAAKLKVFMNGGSKNASNGKNPKTDIDDLAYRLEEAIYVKSGTLFIVDIETTFISIINVSGATVISNNTNGLYHEIDVTSLPTGIYLLKLKGIDNKVRVEKIIIQ